MDGLTAGAASNATSYISSITASGAVAGTATSAPHAHLALFPASAGFQVYCLPQDGHGNLGDVEPAILQAEILMKTCRKATLLGFRAIPHSAIACPQP